MLYLVNAAESPQAAGYVAPEMELLAWVGKPVLVLLNQLGAPRAAHEEAAEVERLAQPPGALAAGARRAADGRLRALLGAGGHAAARRAGRAAGRARRGDGAPERGLVGAPAADLRRLDARAGRQPGAHRRRARDGGRRPGWASGCASSAAPWRAADEAPAPTGGSAAAQQRLAAALDAEVRDSTTRLIELHGLRGPGAGGDPGARGRPVRAPRAGARGPRRDPGRRRHRRAGRAEGRHRQRRPHARRRPHRRRPARRAGRGRAGARHQRRARHRPQLGGLERRGAWTRWSRPRCCATWRWRTSAAAAASGCRARRRRTGRRRWSRCWRRSARRWPRCGPGAATASRTRARPNDWPRRCSRCCRRGARGAAAPVSGRP